MFLFNFYSTLQKFMKPFMKPIEPLLLADGTFTAGKVAVNGRKKNAKLIKLQHEQQVQIFFVTTICKGECFSEISF